MGHRNGSPSICMIQKTASAQLISTCSCTADGIQWERGQQVLLAGSRTLEQDRRVLNGPGDVTTIYHDHQQNRFLACLRFASATDVENMNRSRGFLFTDRLDKPIDLAQVSRLDLLLEGATRNGDMTTDE